MNPLLSPPVLRGNYLCPSRQARWNNLMQSQANRYATSGKVVEEWNSAEWYAT